MRFYLFSNDFFNCCNYVFLLRRFFVWFGFLEYAIVLSIIIIDLLCPPKFGVPFPNYLEIIDLMLVVAFELSL